MKEDGQNLWFRQTFQLKVSVIPRIGMRVGICTLFALIITVLHNYLEFSFSQPLLGNLVPSVVLGLLLVFRTNTAYDRFWDGRKLWGIIAISNCQGIYTTPLPLAYSIHLKHLLLIYCLALPFQMVEQLGWWNAPVVGLISFALLGIEEIGLEIEDPFGYDPNDLPLDNMCRSMSNEVEELIASGSRLKSESI